eukprot:Gregarina_sp_Poly_1__1549@NODE_1391_length_4229_cov_517_587218_g892_i1_p2_GENE_NODE_1391_length_4229_cov_517_587218_g892_i1NODE_1391_length_4229_cov_517_587218_g892_i1_p2_ORF_typecomplete_len481_score72_24PGM_PMM_I/PF02878_16/3e41PGM_PMM_II/PF02879_16/5_3e22PGM_PMM_III/PF02880_16/2_2e03PGM_PMM_III/PF02880_16/6e19_NODE_1391_length_4229_cov_517_587218_g892_i14411883
MDSRIEEYKLWERDPIFLEELNSNINNEEYLVNRFQKNLKFGTAGLRSVMGCGWNAMNPATVQQATQGVCQYFIDSVGLESMKKNCVVIGFDARHHSRWFAHIASAVFISQGVPVMLGDSYTATPITPFLVKKHSAVCGIQITASHNPAADNGYKLYAGNGVQIIPPVDSEIHSRLLAQATPWPGVWELLDLEKKSLVLPHELVLNPLPQAWEAYKLELATSLGMLSSTLEASALKIVYTAMHGVGHKFVHDFLTSVQGLPSGNLYSVPEQQEPDPDFPTVAYPNPEEKGALDFAMAYADSVGAPLIIANDPDADRFAAVEKIEGKWHMFTGDELGAVFALVMFSRARDQGIPAEQLLMVNSSVSSQFLSRMCSVEGCTYLETLTGFKWIMNTALEAAEKYGLQLCLGYEEAIGYGVSSLVLDKDGISAAAVFAGGLYEVWVLSHLQRLLSLRATRVAGCSAGDPPICCERRNNVDIYAS